MRQLVIGLLALTWVAACGDDERPQALGTSNTGTGGSAAAGTGGASGSAGASGSPDDAGAGGSSASAGTGGTAGSGGSAGNAGTAGTAGGAAAGGSAGSAGGSGCGTLDPGAVYLHGTLREGTGELDALASPADPNAFCVGFPPVSGYAPPFIRPFDGALIYVDSDTLEIRRFIPESLVWDADDDRWRYPSAPEANDELIVQPSCTGVTVTETLSDPRDGRVLYRCAGGGYYEDSTGTTLTDVIGRIYCIDGDGVMLAQGTIDHPMEVLLIDDQGDTTVVTGLPGSHAGIIVLARPASGGFYAVVNDIDEQGGPERWFISHDGTATYEGMYCEIPVGSQMHPGPAFDDGNDQLDADGNLWSLSWHDASGSTTDIVVKRELSGDCTVVYDEADVSSNTYADWEAASPTLSVRAHGSSLAARK